MWVRLERHTVLGSWDARRRGAQVLARRAKCYPAHRFMRATSQLLSAPNPTSTRALGNEYGGEARIMTQPRF
jgi:hypothetical protein